MSALGQKRRFGCASAASALPNSNQAGAGTKRRYGPQPDSRTAAKISSLGRGSLERQLQGCSQAIILLG